MALVVIIAPTQEAGIGGAYTINEIVDEPDYPLGKVPTSKRDMVSAS